MIYMNYLEQLKQLVADSFKDANDKTTIENAAKINAKIEELAQEQQQLLDKNKELATAYKEAVLHTSVKPNPNIQNADNATGGAPVDFNAFLASWAKDNIKN